MIRLWVAAPRQVRLPPHTLRLTTAGLIACSALQFVASTPSWVRKVNSASRSFMRWLTSLRLAIVGMGVLGEDLDALGEIGDDLPSFVFPELAGVEGFCEDVSHLAGRRTGPVGVVGRHLVAAPEKVARHV